MRKARPTTKVISRLDRYSAILSEVVDLLEAARTASARVINSIMTTTYWQVGKRIVETEQSGFSRAGYGEQLLVRLSVDLTRRFGRGFSAENLRLMRKFYMAYQVPISQTTSGKSIAQISQTPSGKCSNVATLQTMSAMFPLPWSHYVRLLSVENLLARGFYEAEALRGGWTIKQLDRQIDSLFYERTALSRDKVTMLTKHAGPKPGDEVSAEQRLKDPFMLEFLGLKDEYSESELEEALIKHLETFLLELGSDFTFVGRQRRLRIGGVWYRIDLLFYHRRLRCLVIIDLKTGQFTHADAGQMHLYCNYAREHWTHADENPPVGLILASATDDAIAHYALNGLSNKVLAAEYKTHLPSESLLADEIGRTRRLLESRFVRSKQTKLPAKKRPK